MITEKDLVYAATVRCPCGAGMAYVPGRPSSPDSPFKYADAWDCSDILLGRAVPLGEPGAVQHSDLLPFAFYEIKGENQPSARGATTRPTKEQPS